MLSDAAKKLIEHELLLISDADVVLWAVQELGRKPESAADPDICELASLPTQPSSKCEAASELLRAAVARAHPEFDSGSAEAETHARTAFLTHCNRLLAEELTPYQFCRVINPIEQQYDFPSWLGDFFNQCDWCEPESKRRDFTHLVDYAKRYIEKDAV